MKPIHEQEWRAHGEAVNLMNQRAVVAEDGRMVCMTRAEDGRELERAIAALPDMERTLLEFVDAREDVAVTRRKARLALEKAGVLP